MSPIGSRFLSFAIEPEAHGIVMTFRRERDALDEFLTQFGEDVVRCGIPEYIVTNKKRFKIFLQDGVDEWEFEDNPNGYFDARHLPDDQIAMLAELVARNLSESYRARITSRWRNFS
jgi:hypothetical protein